MNISIFGLGYVGCVSLGCLAESGHKIIGVDISKTKVDQINSGKATIVESGIEKIISEQRANGHIIATTETSLAITGSEMSIIAVGTPTTDNGHLNLQQIITVIRNIGEALKLKTTFHIISIRSTVMPGACDKFAAIVEEFSGKKRNLDFAIVDNPEFLREGTAIQDYYNPPFTLIGSDNMKAAERVADLYRQLPGEIILTDLKIAELMKYINNTFHALKVSFGNEIGNICSELRIDSHKVMEIFCKDLHLNISPYYLKPGFAYGGSCLPKDLKGLQTLAHDLYINVPVINSIHHSNDIQIQRAIKLIYKFWDKKLGFLGLSFKDGTDDLRNSPAVTVIESLIGKGCDITIYDNNINLALLTGKNKEYINSRIPHLATLLTDDPSRLIDTSDVIIINTRESEYVKLLGGINDKIIIDFVRLDDALLSKSNYFGINW